VVITRFLLQHY